MSHLRKTSRRSAAAAAGACARTSKSRKTHAREPAVTARRVGDGGLEILSAADESLDVDEIAQFRAFQKRAELLGQHGARRVDEDLGLTNALPRWWIEVIGRFRDEIDDDRSVCIAHPQLHERGTRPQRLHFQAGSYDALFNEARQLFQLRAIAPKEIEVACIPVPEIHAAESRPAAEDERRLDVRQRFEDARLNRAQLTAG